MTKEQDHIKKCHELAAEWFKDHQATAACGSCPDTIEWRRPGTSNYAMRFILLSNYIIVTGDVGDAIYAWTCETTRKQLLRFDWHYFIGKCVASETGRDYTQKIPGVSHPVPNIRAIAHFVGLQMALRQLGETP
jgi:hypothetical protein